MRAQPEALRLAELMDYLSNDSYEWRKEFDKCAAELRRLYAEVDRLSYQLAYPDNFVKESPLALLHRCETEMRYAGWDKREVDNYAKNEVYEEVKSLLEKNT